MTKMSPFNTHSSYLLIPPVKGPVLWNENYPLEEIPSTPPEQPSATADTATSRLAPDWPFLPVRGIRIWICLPAWARTLFSQQTIFWGLGTHSLTSILHTSGWLATPSPSPIVKPRATLPPFKLASTKMRMVLTQSSKFSGVTWAASRTMKDRDSTHFMRDFVSCGPKSSPTVRLYWLTRGEGPSLLSPAVDLEVSMSSFPTCRAQQEGSITSSCTHWKGLSSEAKR